MLQFLLVLEFDGLNQLLFSSQLALLIGLRFILVLSKSMLQSSSLRRKLSRQRLIKVLQMLLELVL